MNNKFRPMLIGLLAAGILAAVIVAVVLLNPAVLDPKGVIAHKQRDLMLTASMLMLIIVVPVFALTFGIAWKYRAGNTKAKYQPEWDHNRTAETVWWTVPSLIILALSVIIWRSSHELDPYRPLVSDVKPITIQVVALPWKWLFIYPEQNLVTVSQVKFPEDTPINFEITSDAPMNSFWIPQLAGQVYAMTGMTTKLHLMAEDSGTYQGSSANLSGEGFADMKFTATSTSRADFDAWVTTSQQTSSSLDQAGYAQLAKPSKNYPASTYTLATSGLYDGIINKYMGH